MLGCLPFACATWQPGNCLLKGMPLLAPAPALHNKRRIRPPTGRSSMRRCTSRQVRSAALWSMLSDGDRLAIGHLSSGRHPANDVNEVRLANVSHNVCDAQLLQVKTFAEFAQKEVWAWASTNSSGTSKTSLLSKLTEFGKGPSACERRDVEHVRFQIAMAAMPGRDARCLKRGG